MLRIRREQMQTLGDGRREKYVRQMLALLRTRYPQTLAEATDEDLVASIHAGMDAGPRHGFEDDEGLGRFVELAALLGPGFEAEDWASSLLLSADAGRSLRLYHAGLLRVDLDE
jgi:hypothetical protein